MHSSSFFFFYYCGDRRDLHSFPTRRSSDLARRISVLRDRRHRALAPPSEVVRRRREGSGEHTSELQSPDQLVCRLLLERKKQIYTCRRATAYSNTISRGVSM